MIKCLLELGHDQFGLQLMEQVIIRSLNLPSLESSSDFLPGNALRKSLKAENKKRTKK